VGHRYSHPGEPLCGGVDEYQGVFLPGCAAPEVAVATPQVYHLLPSMVDGARGAQIVLLKEISPELILDLFEAWGNGAMNRCFSNLIEHLSIPLWPIVFALHSFSRDPSKGQGSRRLRFSNARQPRT
jgi:hypothetical protein